VLVLRPWEGSNTDVSPPPSRPDSAEVSLHRAEPGDTLVALSSDPLAGATGYFVYRDGGKDPLNPTPVTETKYADIGLTNGRAYKYEIAPTDSAGVPGKRSAEITVAPQAR
jgi:hypothetical protein